MKRRHWLVLTLIFGGTLLCFITLYSLSPLGVPISKGNFDRLFIEKQLGTPRVANLGVNSYYIAGFKGSTVYLGNYTSPLALFEYDGDLRKTINHRITTKALDSIVAPKAAKIIVSPPYFYFCQGPMSEILRGTIGSWEAHRFMPDKDYFFVDAANISPSTFALKSFNVSREGFELARKTATDTPYFEFKNGILEPQIDKIFSVDGKLHYSPQVARLIYLYTYRNQYTLMDTSLSIIHRGTTIDSNSYAKIKVSTGTSSQQKILASPPTIVNGKSCVFDRYLLIQSPLMARNENTDTFKKNIDIDVYDIMANKYIHTFQMPKFKNESLLEFKVAEGRLYAIYNNYLLSYELPTEFLPNIATHAIAKRTF